MPELKNKIPNNIQGRAMVQPSTLNEEERTVEVVFGTDAPVRMYDWEIGEFMEIMSFDEGHIRWDRFENGAPVLDNHNRYNGTKGVLGKVENYRVEDGKGIATLRFSKREEVEPIYQDVKDGILTGISFGYRVFKYEQITSEEGELPKMRAIDWMPFEISLAPIQADHNAFVRKDEEKLRTVEIIPLNLQSERSKDTKPNNENENKMPESTEQERAAQKAADLKARKEAEAKAAKDAATAERSRIKEISDLCRKFEMDEEFTTSAVDSEKSVDSVRKEIMAALEVRQEKVNSNQIRVAADETDKYRAAVEESIVMRVAPSTKDEKGGSEFRGKRLLRLAEDVLERSGVNTKGMSERKIAETALLGERSGLHTTSDFPIILGNTINRQLQGAYAEAPRTFQPFCRQSSIADFRQKTVAKLSGLIDSFKEVPEGAEYEATTLSEDKEAYGLVKYGRKIGVTWESIINDDLNAFSRIPMAIARKAAQKQSDIVYAILTGNPNMNDGNPLFDAAHKNLGTAGAISDTTLAELRKLLRQQTGIEGDYLNLMAEYLIVGPTNENAALKYMNAAFSPSTVANTNIYQGSMQVIVDPRITSNNWFAAASPSMVDTIEYSFLDGEGELFTEQRVGFDVDGLEVKARMVFGAKAIDHRGLYKNPQS